MSKFTDLLDEINDNRFLVSSIYQYEIDKWVCHLRPIGKMTTLFGCGNTAYKACVAAWSHRTKASSKDAFDRKFSKEDLNPSRKSKRIKSK